MHWLNTINSLLVINWIILIHLSNNTFQTSYHLNTWAQPFPNRHNYEWNSLSFLTCTTDWAEYNALRPYESTFFLSMMVHFPSIPQLRTYNGYLPDQWQKSHDCFNVRFSLCYTFRLWSVVQHRLKPCLRTLICNRQ